MLKPLIQLTPPSSSSLFMTTLQATFPTSLGWNFISAKNELKGSFDIIRYKALGFPTRVGADLSLAYEPKVELNDPNPVNNFLYWIQLIVSNHTIIPTASGLPEDLGHGTRQAKIDVVKEQTNPSSPTYNPFYETFGRSSAKTASFYDIPGRQDVYEEHDWYAELYLVEVKNPLLKPREVTIYNGMSWGWQNKVTPCIGGSGGGGCPTITSTSEGVNQDLLLFDSGNPSQPPKSVPEPISVLGLLALGAWGAVQGLKIRRDKQQ